jgi:hypothetical protein
MLRALAALAVLVGASLLILYLWWIGESPFSSPEDRHLRDVKERVAVPDTCRTFTFEDFAALPHARPLAEFAPLERQAVSLEGYVQAMQLSLDGDYHLAIIRRADPERWLAVPPVTGEITPQWMRGSRRWTGERLNARFRPFTKTGGWPGGPRRARISGWLLYDFQYDEPYLTTRLPLQPSPGEGRLTGWEIHPVTRIEFWDDSLRTFVEYPR